MRQLPLLERLSSAKRRIDLAVATVHTMHVSHLQKSIRFWVGGVLLFVCAVLIFPIPVHSQEASAIPVTIDATVSSTLRKQQAGSEISDLRELYKSQIEVYRSSDQQFRIAKEQHARLQTLASLEEAVRATREALLNRSRVLVTYVQMIRLTLLDIAGVELSQKQVALERLEALEKKLLAHQDAILNTQNRTEIAARADEFSVMQKELHATIYFTLSLISHGSVQTVYDQAVLVQRDIEQYHKTASASALVTAERTRAHAETVSNLQTIQTQLSEVMQRIVSLSEEIDKYNKNSHERTLEDLEAPHVRLTQLVGFLQELLRL